MRFRAATLVALVTISLCCSCVGFRYFPQRHQFYGIDSVGQMAVTCDIGIHTLGVSGAYSPFQRLTVSGGAALGIGWLAPKKFGFLIPLGSINTREHSAATGKSIHTGAEYYFTIRPNWTGNISLSYNFEHVEINSTGGIAMEFYPNPFKGEVIKDFHTVCLTPSFSRKTKRIDYFVGCTAHNVFTLLPHYASPVFRWNNVGIHALLSPRVELHLKQTSFNLGASYNVPLSGEYDGLMFERASVYAKFSLTDVAPKPTLRQ